MSDQYEHINGPMPHTRGTVTGRLRDPQPHPQSFPERGNQKEVGGARPEFTLETVTHQLADRLSFIMSLVERARVSADKLCGPAPENDEGKDGYGSLDHSYMHSLNRLSSQLEEGLDQLSAQLHRIEVRL